MIDCSTDELKLADAREARRLHAFELYQQGWTAKEIATHLSVSKQAARQWIAKGKRGGREALLHTTAPGASPKLTRSQWRETVALVAKYRHKIKRRDVLRVIKQHFGVTFHPNHLSRLLRDIYTFLDAPTDEIERLWYGDISEK